MSRAPQEAPVQAAKSELLSRLGLPASADEQAIEQAYEQIGEFLDGAPADLKEWADRRRREADRVYDLLTGSEAELAKSAARLAPATATRRPLPKPAMWAIGLLAGIGLVFAVYQLGKPPAPPAMTGAQPGTQATASAPKIDQAKVAELMSKIQANPKDAAALVQLGNLYLDGGDYANADTFFHKVLEFDATNEKALLGSGIAGFNLGKVDEAEAHLKKAAELYPNNPEVHYGLGFIYMTTKRMDLMQAEWAKVVALAPDSDMAKLVQQHVGSVKTPSPTATPGK